MKKKLIIIMATICVIISIIPIIIIINTHRSINSGGWNVYNSLSLMSEASTDVVRAEVISSVNKSRDFAVYTIHILEVFQGDLQVGNEVEMIQWGRRSIWNWNRDWASIRVEDDLVLFLRAQTNSPASIFGVYRLSRSIPNDVEIDASIRLISVRSRRLAGDGVEVTIEDLWSLRED